MTKPNLRIITKVDLKTFLQEKCTVIQCPAGSKYYYCPYWFRETNNGNLVTFSFDHLPSELVKEMERVRDFKPEAGYKSETEV